MICSDIWHKYHKWYFTSFIWNFTNRQESEIWDNFEISQDAKYHIQIMLLFVYTPTRKGFVIFTHRYFKLSQNTTARSQSNRTYFSCGSISMQTLGKKIPTNSCNSYWTTSIDSNLCLRLKSEPHMLKDYVSRFYKRTQLIFWQLIFPDNPQASM